MKIGDIVLVWDKKNYSCLGWGEIVGIGLRLMEGVLLAAVENKLVWVSKYHCIPETKALEITERIGRDLF